MPMTLPFQTTGRPEDLGAAGQVEHLADRHGRRDGDRILEDARFGDAFTLATSAGLLLGVRFLNDPDPAFLREANGHPMLR